MHENEEGEMLWIDAPRGDIQIRLLVLSTHANKNRQITYQVALGDEWASGYDERVFSSINIDATVDGAYCITFVPVGEDLGWDSIESLKLVEVGKQHREICRLCQLRVECLSHSQGG